MFVDFKNIKVQVERDVVIFFEKEYGISQLEYVEMLISGYMDYIYYHYGDDPMTKIIISIDDYTDWLKEALKNGTEM